MPYTTYGLFVAMRSHRIDNPSVEISLRTGRPNACNLCHLNRTLAWTSEYLSKWYGSTPVPVKGDEKEVAASILWLLRGDAAQRAIVAWSMGWQAARAVSDQAWLIPYLAQLLDDPYSAVRMVAYKSLRQILGYEELKYDFVAARAERLRARDDIIAAWGGRRDRTGVGKPEILMDARGRLVRDRFDHLLKQRDDKPIRIIE